MSERVRCGSTGPGKAAPWVAPPSRRRRGCAPRSALHRLIGIRVTEVTRGSRRWQYAIDARAAPVAGVGWPSARSATAEPGSGRRRRSSTMRRLRRTRSAITTRVQRWQAARRPRPTTTSGAERLLHDDRFPLRRTRRARADRQDRADALGSDDRVPQASDARSTVPDTPGAGPARTVSCPAAPRTIAPSGRSPVRAPVPVLQLPRPSCRAARRRRGACRTGPSRGAAIRSSPRSGGTGRCPGTAS